MHAVLCSLSFLCGLLIPVCALAQPDTLWTARLIQAGSATASPVLYGATPLSDGSFAVVGVADPGSDRTDIFAARINAVGDVSWSRSLGVATADETATAVVQTSDGNLVVVGYGGYGATSNLLMIWGLSVTGDSLWTRSYGSSGATQGSSAQLLPDGNIIITGYRLGTDLLHSDLWLLKCTPNGDTLWTRVHGGGGTDLGNGILTGPDGKLIIAGSSTSFGAGDYDVWLLITDSLGNQLSTATAGTSGTERSYGMGMDSGVVWIAGRTAATGSVDNDAYLVKADTSGIMDWARSFTVGRTEEQFRGVAPLDIGGVLCVGWAGVNAAAPKPWIANVTSDGTLHSLWIGEDFQQGQLYGLCSIPNGGFLLYGTVVEGGARKGYLIRMGSGSGISGTVTDAETQAPLTGVYVGVTGRVQHSVTDDQGQFRLLLMPGTYDLVVYGPCVTSGTIEGLTVWEDSVTWVELVAARPRYEVRQTSINVVVHNRVETVEPLKIYNHGAGAMDFSVQAHALVPEGSWLSVNPGQGVVPPRDSVVVSVVISPSAPDDGAYDYYGLLDVHAHSCPDSTDSIPVLATVLDAPDRENRLPLETSLRAAYPNPFNAVTRLAYSLPRAAHVRLTVFDVTGREVRTLVDDRREGGYHEVFFDGAGLPSGLYLVRMESGSYSAVRKLLLLK
ncbi:MAG: carboxypeptidase regulatory-like domain-containing protein [bacterium]|nr:carboxypeptidase regulatory-like domain-containing protein [bacterium]